MCDLIDLNSSDVKGLLASPLIPTPESAEFNENEHEPNRLMAEKRESPGSNPFDKALHETVDYISKKDDPFEVMLQRALKCKSKKNADLRALDFMDDFTPKRRKRHLKMMNKTLDDSLIGDTADLFNDERIYTKAKLKKEAVSSDANNTGVVYNNDTTENSNIVPKQSRDIFITEKSEFESSILDQSAMNDTLLEVDSKHRENSEISIFTEENTLPKHFLFPPSASLQLLHFRHLSVQEDRESSEKLSYLDHRRSKSTTSVSRTASLNDSSATCTILERGFLESKQSEQSVFSTLSNVSSIARLNSISNISSSLSTNTTMNHAFLDSGSLKTSHENVDSAEIKTTQYDLSDLVDKFNRLKCAIDGSSNVSSTKELEFKIIESNSIKEGNDEQITNDKLVDLDVFLPQPSFGKECNKSTTSISSLDSVFIDNSKLNKSILNEAKALARTFEELTLKTDSESSIDDLISNNDEWMSELVPAFEDDAVDNLIEFTASPKRDEQNIKESNTQQSPTSAIEDAEDSLQETKSKFADSAAAVKETIVTTLLLDLKKLVKAEDNPEAIKLIDNLENVLSTKCISNTELLATCLNTSNELQTPITVDNKSDIEQTNKTSIDQNQEENKKVLSEENIYDRETSPSHISHESDDTSQVVISSTLSTKISPCKDNSENSLNITISPGIALNNNHNKEKNNDSDEKLAMELFINLGKLLNGQAEDTMILQLLKNIGKTLNIVSSHNCEVQNASHTDHEKHEQIASLEISKSKYDANSSISKKAVRDHSSTTKSKSSKKIRRSISVINSPTKNMSNMQTHKDVSELKGLRKRFSSDPGFINTITNKKIVIPEKCNTRKAETAEFDNKREKLLAISDVKNKLKKKSDGVNKRGPMKAIQPVSNMQKRVSLGRSTVYSQITTPPKSNKATHSGSKIISSTPNSVDSNYMPIKVVKSKPVASSTPDGQHNKISNTHSISTSSSKKRNFSCDISPVTTHVNNDGNDEQKDSPTRSTKLPTPKRFTPKRQQTESSGIPKYVTPPRKHSSSFDMNNHRSVESPQYLNRSFAGYQRYSPVRPKNNTEKILHSPLKDSNKIATKVKPLKLISKLKRHSISDIAEKENNYI